VFYDECLRISPTPTPVSITFSKLDPNNGDNVKDFDVPNSSRLTDRYPATYEEFFGMLSGAPCIYKSAPACSERQAPQAQHFIHEARPAYGHPIAGAWPKIDMNIYKSLNSRSVMWTSIDPFSFANAKEKTPFCSLSIWIDVKHKTLLLDAAAVAANAIEGMLSLAGFSEG